MSDHEVKMIILSTDDLDESIKFYSETLGMGLKFRDGAHFAALDGGRCALRSVLLAARCGARPPVDFLRDSFIGSVSGRFCTEP